MQTNFRRAALALTVTAALSGCVSVGPRPGSADINALLTDRGAPAIPAADSATAAANDAAIRDWLTQPMTVDSAVRVAMVRSPKLQQEYARLGLAQADILEAVQIANPRFSVSRLRSETGTGSQLSTGLMMPLVDLLVLPTRTRLAKAAYESARLEIAAAILSVSADVQAAWYSYVGARQVAELRDTVAQSADTSSETAQRFFDAGNISELQLKQEQAAASEARIDSARAQANAQRTHLALNTLIGLSGADAEWETSDRLLQPVPEEDDPAMLTELARVSNLSLLAARQEVAVFNSVLSTTRHWRWLGGSEIGYLRETEVDSSRIKGPSLALELPIFNQGQARLARIQAQLAQAKARLAAAELGTDNAVRLGAQQVRVLSQVVSTHRDALIPQRESVMARSQEQQNFMLIGVFELIQAKVKEFDAYQSYLEAVRDYWLARVDLMRAVGQRLPSDTAIGKPTPSVKEIVMPPGEMPGMDMHKMKMDDAMPIQKKPETPSTEQNHHHGDAP